MWKEHKDAKVFVIIYCWNFGKQVNSFKNFSCLKSTRKSLSCPRVFQGCPYSLKTTMLSGRRLKGSAVWDDGLEKLQTENKKRQVKASCIHCGGALPASLPEPNHMLFSLLFVIWKVFLMCILFRADKKLKLILKNIKI